MTAQTIELVGLTAGTITTLSFLPQAVTVYRRKSGEDLSYSYLAGFSLGVVLWLIYGLTIRSTPVIYANTVTLVLVVIIIVLKAHYARHNPPGRRRAEDKKAIAMERSTSLRD